VKAKGIVPRIDVNEHLHVEANRSALALVLTNLVGNAARYTDTGYVSFTFADGWLRIEHTGRGVPLDALSRVFERFYRADTAHAGAQGFGIGLSIVRKIRDRYAWSIQLESEPGRGTRVSVRLTAASRIPAELAKN
jgi:signal transduction histidine kinase